MNIGIIGLGAFAEYHIQAIHQVESINLVAVSRRNAGELDAYCKRYNLRGYTDYHELLEDKTIDSVLIATPHHLHTAIVEEAAKKGKHIILEKPLAENREGLRRIEQAVCESGIRFMAGYSNHFSRASIKAKEMADSGEIGDIISGTSVMHKFWMVPERREWHLDRETGGGMWLTIGVHLLDRLTFFIGNRISKISANLKTCFHNQNADDSATAFVRYENGATGYVSAIGYNNGSSAEETLLIGTKGMLRISQQKGVHLGKNDRWIHIVGTETKDKHLDALTEEWRTFKTYVEQGDAPGAVPLDFALHIMDAVFAGEESSKEQREVIVKIRDTGK